MAARHDAETPDAAPACACDAVITALARAVCTLARELPGAPASMRQILTGQLQLGPDAASAIITATRWTG